VRYSSEGQHDGNVTIMRRANREVSRAAQGGLAALSLVILTVSSFAAVRLAPAGSHRAAPRLAPAGHAPLPAATDMAKSQWAPSPFAGAPTMTPDPTASYSTPVPPSTELVSLPPGAPYVLDWPVIGQNVVGELGPTTWGGPTARPVVETMGDWLEIRLDTRPNGSTAWVRREDVVVTTTPYRIVVSVSQRRLTLYQNGLPVYSAPVGVGKPQWPTPLGPSFVDAVYRVLPFQLYIYGPVALVTASHSNVLTDFDGGDGTVAIHGYPSDPASTMGVASSHGCIRANPQTMATISQVPAGTPIDFNP
jgi:lipoprotein-anchoring transpeptidase ErfK/SrfK